VNDMNVTCGDREGIFMDGAPKNGQRWKVHAANCAECGEEVRIWKSMSTAAGELRQEWERPICGQRLSVGLPNRWRKSRHGCGPG